MWYNSTTGSLRGLGVVEAWASGSAMIRNTSTAGANHALGAGIQTAAIYAGGYSPYTNKTEHYNGTGWSSGGNMNLTRITTGFGTETAAVAAGGITFPGVVGGQVEEYDGSSWTTGNALGTARPYGSGSGTLTAGLYAGGSPNASAATSVANSEEYNGTNWSEGNDLNTARRFLGSAATAPQTAALVFGGDNAPAPGTVRSFTETYDGTSWTEVGDLNTARRNMGGAGDFTSALAFGGSLGPPGNSTATESWDGSSWSTSPASLANARDSQPSIGTSTAALFVGGPNPAFPGGWVEEYNKSTNVITAAAFSSGGSANTARRQLGYTGAGTQNAFMVYGGFSPSGMLNASEEYGGATWTATPNLNTARGQNAGFGITTAALALQGDQGPSTPFGTTCEEYDGTNWSSGGTASTARRTNSGVGTQTATITAGGQIPGPSATANVESYDGTSFSEVNNLNVARGGNAVMGGPAGATSSVITGGNVPTQFSISEQWNGTSMVTGASMANDRSTHGAGGTSALGIVGLGQIGPSPPYGDADTEEYVGETTAVNIADFTTS
jgi:hypothetical protein